MASERLAIIGLVACPVCGAEVGVQCRTKRGKAVQHLGRRRLAARMPQPERKGPRPGSGRGLTGPPRRFETDCEDCGRAMVSQRAWHAMPPAERAEAIVDGFVRQGVGPRCNTCVMSERRRA